VHNRQEILGQTGHKMIGAYKGAKDRGPIQLYEHATPSLPQHLDSSLGEYDAGPRPKPTEEKK